VAPSKYLADNKKTPGFPFETVLQSHWLPTGADSPLLNDDTKDFSNGESSVYGRRSNKSQY
jgi:hypothetical protein